MSNRGGGERFTTGKAVRWGEQRLKKSRKTSTNIVAVEHGRAIKPLHWKCHRQVMRLLNPSWPLYLWRWHTFTRFCRVVHQNSGFTTPWCVLEWWLAITGCRDRRSVLASDCRLRFSRHWWPHPTIALRTPLTDIQGSKETSIPLHNCSVVEPWKWKATISDGRWLGDEIVTARQNREIDNDNGK